MKDFLTQAALTSLRANLTAAERREAEIRAEGEAARFTTTQNPYSPRSAAFAWWKEANEAV